MGKYQIFEIDQTGEKILHHSLDLEHADKLAKAYGGKNPEKAYGFAPMHNIDENDVDFSNDIIKDMIKEKISDEIFLDEFLRRKKSIKQALINMTLEAKNNTRYTSDELFGLFNEPEDSGDFILDLESAREERAEKIMNKYSTKTEKKWFDIEGSIEIDVDENTFNVEFHKWVKSKGWSFAGAIKLSKE